MSELRRGRPAKEPPETDIIAYKAIREAVKKYADYKMRIRYVENVRKSLIVRAEIDLEQSEIKGYVVYNKEQAMHFPDKDKVVLNNYLREKNAVLGIEKGISIIPDGRTKEIATKTILEGKSCEAEAVRMGIPRRTMFREKRRALKWIGWHWTHGSQTSE